jgi:hypothetical protein
LQIHYVGFVMTRLTLFYFGVVGMGQGKIEITGEAFN